MMREQTRKDFQQVEEGSGHVMTWPSGLIAGFSVVNEAMLRPFLYVVLKIVIGKGPVR